MLLIAAMLPTHKVQSKLLCASLKTAQWSNFKNICQDYVKNWLKMEPVYSRFKKRFKSWGLRINQWRQFY